MTDKERNELAYNAFWCEWDKSKDKQYYSRELYDPERCDLKMFISLIRKYPWSKAVLEYKISGWVKLSNEYFHFYFENDKEKYDKVISIITAKKKEEQQQKDNLLLSMQCTNENNSQ